jgi:nitrate reductase cytochrome c-type subunit
MKILGILVLLLAFSACQPQPKKYINDNESYVGAPPLITHEVDGYEDCADCHTDDGDEDATQTPHGERTACIQCHIPANTDIRPEFKNSFKTKYHLTKLEKEKLLVEKEKKKE